TLQGPRSSAQSRLHRSAAPAGPAPSRAPSASCGARFTAPSPSSELRVRRPSMPPEDQAPRDYRSAIAAIARRLEREDYSPGDLAQLRRLEAEAPDGKAFWALLAQYAPEAWDDPRLQRALAAVVRGMA